MGGFNIIEIKGTDEQVKFRIYVNILCIYTLITNLLLCETFVLFVFAKNLVPPRSSKFKHVCIFNI